MSSPRAVSPMMRTIEDRLVAVLGAVEAPLSRGAIYDRFDEDFEDEEQLAKCLGRLVASGRLLRSKRERPGKPDEFLYQAAKGEAPQPQPEEAATPTASPEQESPMTHQDDRLAKIVEALDDAGIWLKRTEVAKATKIKDHTLRPLLTALLGQRRIQAHGATSSRRYAKLGLALPSGEAVQPAAAPAPNPEGPRRTKRPGRNLAEFGAAPAPAPSPAKKGPESLEYAVDQSGNFALNDGKATIRLTPGQVSEVIGFLERTQLVWKDAA